MTPTNYAEMVVDAYTHGTGSMMVNGLAMAASTFRQYFDNWERDRIEALGARTRPIFGLLWTVDR